MTGVLPGVTTFPGVLCSHLRLTEFPAECQTLRTGARVRRLSVAVRGREKNTSEELLVREGEREERKPEDSTQTFLNCIFLRLRSDILRMILYFIFFLFSFFLSFLTV